MKAGQAADQTVSSMAVTMKFADTSQKFCATPAWQSRAKLNWKSTQRVGSL